MSKSKKSAPKKHQPAVKKPPAKKPAPVAKATPAAKAAPKPAGKALSAADPKRKLVGRKAAPKAIAFSLDEVREIAKKNERHESTARSPRAANNGKPSLRTADAGAALARPHKPHHIKPASLTDILGFSPGKSRRPAMNLDEGRVPEKHRRYFRLLVELRTHVLTQLGEHTEETLLKSAKDDSGDLSGYGQHMADAGTDTFDRDFALSLVSTEQEALSEIEAAIKRIHDGTYGVCELSQKPIAKERLLAVPFTRYSAEAQKQVERTSHRSIQRGGLFGEGADGEEGGGKMTDDDAGGDD